MGVLTEQFIQECLDRHPYDIDMSKLILEIAQGRNVTDALLARVSRPDIIGWLGNEMEVIIDALVPALAEKAAGERNNAETLLGYLEQTKAEGSAGLVVEVERDAAEELGQGSKYCQQFDVTIRFEGAELATWAPDSEGEYRDGKWVAEPVKWPPLLEGLILLPELVSEEPGVEVEEADVDYAGQHEKREQELLREIQRGRAGAAFERADEGPAQMQRHEPPRTSDLFR
jgi:hypothetical protein